ncbi:MAG TPA: hypothetical protein VLB46_17050 [Pyrinomonadaceae bacterium]|nr:hypothetical protein [Pyrinomonadaceae bacterium]
MRSKHKHTRARILFPIIVLGSMTLGITTASSQDWPQWGRNSQHTGAVDTAGQNLRRILAILIYDPFVLEEKGDPDGEGSLPVHYQAALVDGGDVYMSAKTGQFTGIGSWETQIWNEKKFSWLGGSLVEQWNFESDWKPVPNADLVLFFQPVFHAALDGNFVYVPGAGGTVFKVRKSDGSVVTRLNPFGSGEGLQPNTFVVSPITVDGEGSIYYTVLRMRKNDPWFGDPINSWLVKVTADGAIRKKQFTDIVIGATPANEPCEVGFPDIGAPLPPAPDAVAPTFRCGTVRPAINAAPAIGPDGTVVVIARNHVVTRHGYIVALNPDLTPKWTATTRNILNDGCNVTIPPNGTPGGCRVGTTTGVDPETNTRGSGRINDNSTSSPVIAPDGSVIYGSQSRYNYSQGHLLRYSSTGQFLAAYPFGWDVTPAIYKHNGTYSIITKENRYNVGSYCREPQVCPPDRNATTPNDPEAYFITQLSPNMTVEWQYKNTNTQSCTRHPDNSVTCVDDHPQGFEWCVNGVAVDANGVVYGNAEDGNLYAIRQGGILKQRLFMKTALESAYTPTVLANDGKLYVQQNGELFVVGQ